MGLIVFIIYALIGIFYGKLAYRRLLPDYDAGIIAMLSGFFWVFVIPGRYINKLIDKLLDKYQKNG